MAMFVFALTGIKKKSIYSFSILMFLITFSVATNLFFEVIGGLMGERLVFIPSIFAMIFFVAVGTIVYEWLVEKANLSKFAAACTLIIPVFLACTMKTIARNNDWQNDITLNLADIEKSPNSAKVNHGAGNAYVIMADQSAPELKDSLLNRAVHYYKRALEIYTEYADAYMDMGIAYGRIPNLAKAEESWNEFRKKVKSTPKLDQCDAYLVYLFYALELNYMNLF